jgi:hypothetical protein
LNYSSEFLLFQANKAEIPIWVVLGETRVLIRFARTQGSIADLEGTCYYIIWKQEGDVLGLIQGNNILANQCRRVCTAERLLRNGICVVSRSLLV